MEELLLFIYIVMISFLKENMDDFRVFIYI
jgi:hypothetical protein